ncbi:MAG: hypothetical protein AAGB13_05995 [Cyanobacteria bacterium P01_F01_bin.33]
MTLTYRKLAPDRDIGMASSTALLLGFATAFFPRLLTYFGAPAPINFIHFAAVPTAVAITILTSRTQNMRQISISWDLILGMGILLTSMAASALLNDAGFINIILQFILFTEAFMLLLALALIPTHHKFLSRFRRWLLGFALTNFLLAIAQSILIPVGIYPRRGGTIQDNTAGVFAAGGGSAGNYVSCTVSMFFALYVFFFCKQFPLWFRSILLLGAAYQVYVSDSKQVFLALGIALILLLVTKLRDPAKFFLYTVPVLVILSAALWALKSLDFEALTAYQNWIDREGIYGWDGIATQTKLAAFRIILSHFNSPLNWFFGLGPGHSVTRLGGWMLPKYASLLTPLGATVHPASVQVFDVVRSSWIAQQSTIFFPLFTWVGLWGDFGFAGLAAYLYLCSIVWRRICVDDYGRYLLLTTAALGFVLTQMEEPGQMLTLACLLGLRWHETHAQRILNQLNDGNS